MSFGNFIRKTSRHARDYFATEKIDFVPRIGHVGNYSKGKLGGDLRAAVNVTMLALPQAIAVIDRPGSTLAYLSSKMARTFDRARVDEEDAAALAFRKAPARIIMPRRVRWISRYIRNATTRQMAEIARRSNG